MKPAILLLSLVLAAIMAGPAVAAPRSIADCEKIRDDDAYNRCLASFGPKRGVSRGAGKVYPYDARGGTRRVRAGRAAPVSRYRGIRIQRLKHGRVRSTISVPVRRKR